MPSSVRKSTLRHILFITALIFPIQHNIARLLELCPDRNNWDKDLDAAEELTPFAITTRYPGEDEPVSASEAKRAIKIAKLVRKTIRSALSNKGIKI